MTPLIEARRVSFIVGDRPVIEDVDVAVGPGERVAVVGPSGSGKSTLLALLSGLIEPSAGTVLHHGRPVSERPASDAGIATVLQGYGLVSLLTASENVEVALRAAGHDARSARREAAAALGMLGLADHAHQLAHELSGGQQQRVAIARALAVKPVVLVADEPTAELDPAARALALDRLMAGPGEGGALLLATHDPEVAAACHRVIDLAAGRRASWAGPVTAPSGGRSGDPGRA
ncbi:MAG TPA: ATP-binding cassette domain-containing protein [Acidimicrobiales bacterium]|nr:ATP-binding cassette domain-containing protein [Acidimicrobiales bacterium]